MAAAPRCLCEWLWTRSEHWPHLYTSTPQCAAHLESEAPTTYTTHAKSVTFTVIYSFHEHAFIRHYNIVTKTPVFQIRHCKISADVAHFERNNLSVVGHATLGWLVAAAVFWRLKTAIPGRICTHGWLLKERRNLSDVLHCRQNTQTNRLNFTSSYTAKQFTQLTLF